LFDRPGLLEDLEVTRQMVEDLVGQEDDEVSPSYAVATMK
jgi:hypothetical protein